MGLKMTAQTRIRLNVRTLPDFLPGYDVRNFESTMSREETSRLFRLSDELWERGEDEEAERVSNLMPVEPTFALTQYVLLGKEGFLSLGFNLKDVEKAYGEDWLERFDVGNGCIHLMLKTETDED